MSSFVTWLFESVKRLSEQEMNQMAHYWYGKKLIYHAEISERKEAFFHEKVSTRINFHFKDSPLTKVSHKPLYESVEIISCIGGYLGLWLGLCMISAADLSLLIFNNLLVSFYKCIVCLKKILLQYPRSEILPEM
ncbi:uncharacterized protein LOC129224981 [Uloborus diversus]|uniref:uncharacterized protein LOC129224981 n=1 Tax=Uloborus diversus TaxID=327109 RepID=UPI0024092A63|nr:uncharacterized protein LOC129224981 [Uloborus diversus]